MDLKNFEKNIHIKDYFGVIKRRKVLIILFFILVTGIVTAVSFLMSPVYRATVTILIDVESPNVLTTTGMVSLESQDYYSYKEYYQSQKEILTSRSILKKVFDEFGLGSSKDYADVKDPIKKFSKRIKAEPIRDTRLLELHAEDENPVLAADIANRIAEIFVRRNLYYISRDELINLLKNEYLKLETKLSEYSKIYKKKHPKMIRLYEEMKEMSEKIDQVKKSSFNMDVIDDSAEVEIYALEGLKANNISIQDPAEPPKTPVRPKKKINVAVAVIIGLFGGIGLAFFTEYLDDTVKDLEDMKELSEWPLLGTIPKIDKSKTMTEFEKDLLTHIKPKDPTSEAYRAIRTSILFSATEEHPIRNFLVTSPGAQEGKTTTLCNLAATIAQTGKKVLMVDADMRKPRLHEVFKQKNNKGLSDYLSAQCSLDDVIKSTNVNNLSYIAGGPYPPNPSELLSSHKISEFMKQTAKQFDYILFDTPPVAVVTDAIVLSRFTDGIIMVIESGKTSRRVLPRVLEMVDAAKVKVIGTIINKISLKHNAYYHYYYTHYYGKTK